MAVGPYRPIFIKSYSVCIEDLAVTPQVSSKLQTSLDACITLAGVASIVRSFTASISDSEGKIIRKTTRELTDSELALGEASLDWEFSDGEIELWWPAKYGKQTLYTFEAMALDKVGFLFALVTTHSQLSATKGWNHMRLPDQEGGLPEGPPYSGASGERPRHDVSI